MFESNKRFVLIGIAILLLVIGLFAYLSMGKNSKNNSDKIEQFYEFLGLDKGNKVCLPDEFLRRGECKQFSRIEVRMVDEEQKWTYVLDREKRPIYTWSVALEGDVLVYTVALGKDFSDEYKNKNDLEKSINQMVAIKTASFMQQNQSKNDLIDKFLNSDLSNKINFLNLER